MIRQLKKRFILTSMAVVTLVLLLVTGVLYFGARKVIYSDADQMMKRSLLSALGEKEPRPAGDRRGQRAVVLTIDPETGDIENESSATLEHFSEEEQQELVREAAAGKKLKNKGVHTSVAKHNGKTYVAVEIGRAHV